MDYYKLFWNGSFSIYVSKIAYSRFLYSQRVIHQAFWYTQVFSSQYIVL